jgi:hypothetical protein
VISHRPGREEAALYVVAEIQNKGIEFGWTSAVYADIRDAQAELDAACENTIHGQRIFELRPTLVLVEAARP